MKIYNLGPDEDDEADGDPGDFPDYEGDGDDTIFSP
jgi:hypothetical protein